MKKNNNSKKSNQAGLGLFNHLCINILKIKEVTKVRIPKKGKKVLGKHSRKSSASTLQIAIFQRIVNDENAIWRLELKNFKKTERMEKEISDAKFRLKLLYPLFKKVTPFGDFIVKGRSLYEISLEETEIPFKELFPYNFPVWRKK